MPSKAVKLARAKFDKLSTLNKMIDGGDTSARKAKLRMADSWKKRQSNNVTGLFNRKHAKPGACITL